MQPERHLQVHWSPRPDENTSTESFVSLCGEAEQAGVSSVYVPIAVSLSNALSMAAAAGLATSRVKFRIGCGFQNMLATLRGRDLKDAWGTLGNRLIIHIQLEGDDSLSSACELMANWRGLFPEMGGPQFDVEGESSEAAFLAIKHGDCYWRRAHRPNQVYADALPVLHFGKEVGLVSHVIARDTREDAVQAAQGLLSQDDGETSWITPNVWRAIDGTTALIGSFDEIAHAMKTFKKNGISQFLVREWLSPREFTQFEATLMPLMKVS